MYDAFMYRDHTSLHQINIQDKKYTPAIANIVILDAVQCNIFFL